MFKRKKIPTENVQPKNFDVHFYEAKALKINDEIVKFFEDLKKRHEIEHFLN